MPARLFAWLAFAGFITVCNVIAQTDVIPGWTLVGSDPRANSGPDHQVVHGGKTSAVLSCTGPGNVCHGDLQQGVYADIFRGRRVCLSAWVKGRKAKSVTVWMRMESSEGGFLPLDNMGNLRKHGTFDWTRLSIVLDILPSAERIFFGVALTGEGEVWIDDVTLEPVDTKVKSTHRLSDPDLLSHYSIPAFDRTSLHRRPFNLDFESN